MQTNEPLIEITRKDNKLSSVKVIMPTWNELGDDDKIYCNIPLLGGLKTYAMDLDDAKIAIKEAIHCFCVAAEKVGNGLEGELKMLGWQLVNTTEDTVTFGIHSEVEAFELVLETGEPTAVQLEMSQPESAL